MRAPTELRCEYEANPLGLHEPRPRLSWRMACEGCPPPQSAYQILAAHSPEDLHKDRGTLWDSGRVRSARSHAVVYGGPPLRSREAVFWKVRVWDEDGKATAYSTVASFEMALLHGHDWQADWIGWPGGRPGRAVYLRCGIDLPGLPSRARLYITALGFYEVFVNGVFPGGRLQPAVTDTGRRILYHVHDVTGCLSAGKNFLAAVVGNGWHGRPSLLCQLEADYEDGRRLIFCSGRHPGQPTWFAAGGPVRENSIFDGESYDARLEEAGWACVADGGGQNGPRGKLWMPACVVPGPAGVLRAQRVEAVSVVRSLPPAAETEPRPGVRVFDFGTNHSGWAGLSVLGQEGTAVRMKYAELLHADGTVSQENLRTAAAEDCYILQGAATVESWEPRFTYHGYRYVQVEGDPSLPAKCHVVSRVARSGLARRGSFACSHALLNRIHEMVVGTEEANLHGIPTDCPQRDERMGWLNDMAARSEELIYNFDAALLLEKFVDDISDTQDPVTGAIADTAPFHWGFRPADPVAIAYLLIPHLLHAHYGDTRCMERHFDGMTRWIEYLWRRTSDGILEYSHFGDWAPPSAQGITGSEGCGAISAETPGALVSTAFLHRSLSLAARMAVALDRSRDARTFKSRSFEVVEAFHRHFWNPVVHGYGSGNQACNALALDFGLVPDHLCGEVVAALAADIRAHADHLTTGNLATKSLLEVLSEHGHEELALALATQTTYPSWGFMLERGATTLWERWEELSGTGMNSHNHPMFGSIGSWFYRHVAGLRFATPDQHGLVVEICPPRLPGIEWAEAGVETVHGPVVVRWRREPRGICVHCEVPWNCSALLRGTVHRLPRRVPPGSHEFLMPTDQHQHPQI